MTNTLLHHSSSPEEFIGFEESLKLLESTEASHHGDEELKWASSSRSKRFNELRLTSAFFASVAWLKFSASRRVLKRDARVILSSRGVVNVNMRSFTLRFINAL